MEPVINEAGMVLDLYRQLFSWAAALYAAASLAIALGYILLLCEESRARSASQLIESFLLAIEEALGLKGPRDLSEPSRPASAGLSLRRMNLRD